jgi:hypothetical protein
MPEEKLILPYAIKRLTVVTHYCSSLVALPLIISMIP